jgi:hypothetical protein
MVTFVECVNCYTLLFLCLNNLFKLFLVHKISAYKYIWENGKKKLEKKRKRISFPCGPGGDFRPTWARARLAAQLAQLCGGDGGDGAEARAHQPGRGEGADGVGDNGGERGSTGVRPAVGIRGGSPLSVRFCDGEAVAEHGW